MYDLIVIGSGPGGYAAAIRGSQLGMRVAVVEQNELGGVCLNWGCIPTKALLKSASVLDYARHAGDYGVLTGEVAPCIEKIVARSRAVAAQMSKGVEFLMKKNSIEVIAGTGGITAHGMVEVDGKTIETKNIIIATGARPRALPNIPIDGSRVIDSRGALLMERIPTSMVVIGSGAIGAEFATFFNIMGTKVTLVEFADRVAPLEDADISAALERAMRKSKITVMTSAQVTRVDESKVYISGKKGDIELETQVVLSAVGIAANIENLGLEEAGIQTERGKIVVNDHYQTTRCNIYAIGDVIATPALAHVATAEAIVCVEHIAGLNPKPIDYKTIPSCIYTSPEVSSVGLTEAQALERGYEVRVGKFPYTASGKATSAGARDGMVKLVFDATSDKLLGAHMLGLNVTELLGEPTMAIQWGLTAKDIMGMIHSHPTMYEAIAEAAAASHNEAIHL
ncbi:MAG: dihydrolipoyl dehydrogenase [Mucinivorans sp.]